MGVDSPTAGSLPAATPTDERPTRPVTIAFGGDIHFEGFLAERLADDQPTMLDPIADLMADADLAIANLETAVTDRGQPSDKAFNFRADPKAFEALRRAGIDVVSVANNHGMDYGPVGLQDTLTAAADADFPLVGGGDDADAAYAPWTTAIDGTTIAVIGATQVLDSNLQAQWTATEGQPGLASAKDVDRLVATVAGATVDHDIVIAFLHWGVEGETCPTADQTSLADELIAAGAKIVVGAHAHRVQGGGVKDGAVVHYGLGNFVFYRLDGTGTESGVLTITVIGDQILGYEWTPARLVSGVATKTDDPGEADAWEDRRSCTDLTATIP